MRMALLCFLGVIISGLAHSADTEPKEVFENYRKAILEAKGASAAECVSEQTIAYYQAMLDHALKSNQETVQAMMLLDRLMVFSLRSRIPHASLKEMNGKAVFIHAVENSWIGRDSVQNLKDFEIRDGQVEDQKDFSQLSLRQNLPQNYSTDVLILEFLQSMFHFMRLS